LIKRKGAVDSLLETCFARAGELLPLASLMVIALAIGNLCGPAGLNTGATVASALGDVTHPRAVLPLVFLVSSFIAFCTGTSSGTTAIMFPNGLPLATLAGVRSALAVSAVLGGGRSSGTTVHPFRTRPWFLPWQLDATTSNMFERRSPTLCSQVRLLWSSTLL